MYIYRIGDLDFPRCGQSTKFGVVGLVWRMHQTNLHSGRGCLIAGNMLQHGDRDRWS